jgi:hypothetical protein
VTLKTVRSFTLTVSPSWAYPGSENKEQQDFAFSGSANIVGIGGS